MTRTAYVTCKRCDRTQSVRTMVAVLGEVEAEEAHADDYARSFLETIGWRFVPRTYIEHDWSGVAGDAGWLCPFEGQSK